MHNNFYFLRQLSQHLRQNWLGFRIGEILSQAKDELVIKVYKANEEKTIKAHLSPSFCCLSFPEQFNRTRRNSIDLFQQIKDYEIIDVVQIEQDRSFYFQFNDEFQLLFKMHGNRSNVILFHKEKIVEVFKNNLKQDFSIKIKELNKHISLDKIAFQNAGGDYKKLIPTFGKSFDLYFELRKYMSLDIVEQYKCLLTLLEYLRDPKFLIHFDESGLPILSLYEISSEDHKFQNPNDVLTSFYKSYISTFRLEKEKSILRNSLNNQIKKGGSYIRKSSERLEKLLLTTNHRNIGDLIMANLHIIPPYTGEVELTDFYSQKLIKIQLKPTLSPQLNAEKYYRKAKNQQIEIDTLKKNIERKELHITELRLEGDNLNQITQLRQLVKKGKSKPQQIERPYHLVNFLEYEILIGKNAVKNERLTFHIAKKEDLFLHAKDTPGSHVIVKRKSNQNIPKKVIEKAASFAAFFSKNKSVALCRVLYTPKKYVRKAKGAPAGTVKVDREKVILVKPMNFK